MITANQLKTRGVKIFDEYLNDKEEVAVSVHGKVKYVVMSVEQYDRMRAIELNHAYLIAKQEIANGAFSNDLEKHLEIVEQQLDK